MPNNQHVKLFVVILNTAVRKGVPRRAGKQPSRLALAK